MADAVAFGEMLRALRRSAHLPQRELASRAGVDFTYISKIENGKMPPPSDGLIVAMAREINADADRLLVAAGRLPAWAYQEALQRLKERFEQE